MYYIIVDKNTYRQTSMNIEFKITYQKKIWDKFMLHMKIVISTKFGLSQYK